MGTILPRKTITYEIITVVVTNGIGVKTPASSTFIGSVQPTTGKDLESNPTLRQDVGTVKIYSDTQLNVSTAESNKSGDLVQWQGQKWECVKEMIFQNGLIDHYKYFAEYRSEV